MSKILQADRNYTFRSYFELPNDTDEVLAEFGYGYRQARLNLPESKQALAGIDALKQQLEETLPYVQLSSEAAKREVLVAPVLTRVAIACQQVLRFEYPLKVNERLQGSLDYLIRADRPGTGRERAQRVVVVEAKRDDLTRGFTQLAVEMIALAMDGADEAGKGAAVIHGAVTMGSLWVFGRLDVEAKLITQDIGGYQVPDDVERLIRVLVAILED